MSALLATLLIEAGAGLTVAIALATYAQRRWATSPCETTAPQD